MKNSHMRTPRTSAEGQFLGGYTSRPVARKEMPKWLERTLNVLLAVGLALAFTYVLVQELVK